MDVFLMIRRKKQTILLDATEETTVTQLKKTLEAILKRPPDEIQLYKIDTNEALDDARTLGDCGYKSSNSKAQDPSEIGLRLKIDGEYENFDITPYSKPPDLPDVMRTPDVSGGGQMSSVAAGGKE